MLLVLLPRKVVSDRIAPFACALIFKYTGTGAEQTIISNTFVTPQTGLKFMYGT